MPLRLEIKKAMVARSDRVKGVELHPTEPWLLANLYNGNVYIWNYNDSTLVRSFEVTDLPVRAAKFVARKQWVVCGADDMAVRVYNYNTADKVRVFEAHADYIRSIAVHPTLPYLITCSDDMLAKLWDWDRGFACVQVFEGHSHYVMQCTLNPKDPSTFATASLDRTVKVWSLGQPMPNLTLEGHEKGVNCVDYYPGGERPYLVSGADDRTARVWDYTTKACVQVLEGHSHNLSAVAFHPELPILITASEDGAVRLWHSTTYRLENTLSLGLERAWSLSVLRGSNAVAVGFDEGVAVLKVGREEPVASMDQGGKIVWARHNEVHGANVRALGGEAAAAVADGERLPLASKELGATDAYPQSLKHSPNGRFVAACGDGEYVVYTALAWRSKAFGPALEFVWSTAAESAAGGGASAPAGGAADFATREAGARIKIFRNFAERLVLNLDFVPEGIHGGALLGARGPDYVVFYDWATGALVRRIDVGGPVRDVVWSESGEQVALIGDGAFFVLKLDRNVVDLALAGEVDSEGLPLAQEDGIADAFELVAEVPERARTALWVGEALVYTNSAWRLQYCVGGEAATVAHLDRPLYLIGYLAAQSRVYLIGRDHGVVSYALPLPLIGFKAALLRGDNEAAFSLLPSIPREQHGAAARFLEGKGLVREALEVAVDPDHRFDLAVQLGELEQAQAIAESLDAPSKWRQLGELAMARGRLELSRACLAKAGDLAGLLLLHAARGDAAGLSSLADEAAECGKLNVAFACRLLLGEVGECCGLLTKAGRLPEAALFARAYCPSLVAPCVERWKGDLARLNARAAESLADPAGYPNLFPGFEEALEAERAREQERAAGGGVVLAGVAPPPRAATKEAAVAVGGAVAAAAFGGQEEAAPEPEVPVADDGGAAAAQAAAVVQEQEAFEQEEEAWGVGAAAAEEEEAPVAPPPPPPAPPAAAAEEEEELFQETHEEEQPVVAEAPPPPAPAPAAAPVEEDDDFGLDEEPSAVGGGGAAAATSAAPAAAAAAAPAADDLNLDDDWGLDEE